MFRISYSYWPTTYCTSKIYLGHLLPFFLQPQLQLLFYASNGFFSNQARISSAALWGMTKRGWMAVTRSFSSNTLASDSLSSVAGIGEYFHEKAEAKVSLEVVLVSVW